MAKLLNGTRIYGTGTVDTQVLINGTTNATSTNTGALIVAGGAGIWRDLSVGGITSATTVTARLGGTAPTAYVHIGAGTATASTAPLKITAGSTLTVVEPGAFEYDSANTALFFTGNATNGRGLVPNTTVYRLLANGSAVGPTIGAVFGATSSIPLVANGVYEIDIELYFTKATSEAITWTITNSAVVTNMTWRYQSSPSAGLGAAGSPLFIAFTGLTLAANTYASGSFAAANHHVTMRILLENASSTSLRLNATMAAGTLTPLRGSYWKATRLPSTNNSTYAA